MLPIVWTSLVQVQAIPLSTEGRSSPGGGAQLAKCRLGEGGLGWLGCPQLPAHQRPLWSGWAPAGLPSTQLIALSVKNSTGVNDQISAEYIWKISMRSFRLRSAEKRALCLVLPRILQHSRTRLQHVPEQRDSGSHSAATPAALLTNGSAEQPGAFTRTLEYLQRQSDAAQQTHSSITIQGQFVQKFNLWNSTLNNQLKCVLFVLQFSSEEEVNAPIKECIPRIEAHDRCDPAGLRSQEQPCLLKIYQILHYYRNLFGENSVFKGDEFHDLARTLSQLLQQLKGHGVAVENLSSDCIPAEDWKRWFLQRHYMERLKSFSIIVARVFTPGNPSKHDVTGMPQCVTS
ncbi:IL23A protein, partial [Polyodon spathula]|nr:IL23A protein [Polyodon spathula]